MNKFAIAQRLEDLANHKKQALEKQDKGRNVVISGQKIIDETNAMLLTIDGAEQDCRYWLQQILEEEQRETAKKQAEDLVTNAQTTAVAAFEEADAYKVDEDS